MKSYHETLQENARITILRSLEDAPKYTSNISLIVQILHAVGIGYTRDQAMGELKWLEEQALVTTSDHNGFTIVTATQRGVEVAQGVVQHPGIKRPGPGA